MKKIIDNKKLESISNREKDIDKYMLLLHQKYGFSLSKDELSEVLKVSKQTIDRRIKEGTFIPNYIRTGKGKNASYCFTIYEVALFLTNTVKNYT